jgi:phospholipase C
MGQVPGNPKHIVVLMFENRSFDHLFGDFPGANGLFGPGRKLKPDIYNLDDPTSPPGDGNQVYHPMELTPDAPLRSAPNHNFASGMTQEICGPGATGWQGGAPLTPPPVTYPPTMSGFVSTWTPTRVPGPNGPEAMSYYRHGSLQVLHRLAADFVLCERWFCDMPGDTLLNRYFMHTAQTGGYVGDQQSDIFTPSPTIFDQIEAQGRDWRIYAPEAVVGSATPKPGQTDARFLNPHIQASPFGQRPLMEFARDAVDGTLPFYSFLMCWLPTSAKNRDTSMHPYAYMQPGENLLAAVYRALRNSPSWNDTLLIVTFDENGAFYDHVSPPPTIAPNGLVGSAPDGFRRPDTTCSFDFTLLGPRIPALLISPWLRPGIARSSLQNTSILKLLQDQMGIPGLTARDTLAPSLDPVFQEFGRLEVRADCPSDYPAYPGYPYEDGDLSKPVVLAKDEFGAPPYM